MVDIVYGVVQAVEGHTVYLFDVWARIILP